MATATHVDGSASSFQYVTVESGQSLWQLAERSPRAPTRAMWSPTSCTLNQLAGADVQPGQRLAIPAQYSH